MKTKQSLAGEVEMTVRFCHLAFADLNLEVSGECDLVAERKRDGSLKIITGIGETRLGRMIDSTTKAALLKPQRELAIAKLRGPRMANHAELIKLTAAQIIRPQVYVNNLE